MCLSSVGKGTRFEDGSQGTTAAKKPLVFRHKLLGFYLGACHLVLHRLYGLYATQSLSV